MLQKIYVRKYFTVYSTSLERTINVADDFWAGNMTCNRSPMTPKSVQASDEIVKPSPQKSIKRAAIEARFLNTTNYRIMWKSLKLFPYKIRCYQAITNIALGPGKIFTNEFPQIIYQNKTGVDCVWFTDEAHLHLERIVNNKTGEDEKLKIRLCVLQIHFALQIHGWDCTVH